LQTCNTATADAGGEDGAGGSGAIGNSGQQIVLSGFIGARESSRNGNKATATVCEVPAFR
jgi:hypothetical protein